MRPSGMLDLSFVCNHLGGLASEPKEEAILAVSDHLKELSPWQHSTFD